MTHSGGVRITTHATDEEPQADFEIVLVLRFLRTQCSLVFERIRKLTITFMWNGFANSFCTEILQHRHC